MGGVQKELFNYRFGEELFHGKPIIKETNGIMPGSGAKEGENRQVIFRIRGSEHVQIIAEIPTLSVGIPTDVTVRLAVDTVALAVPDAILETVAGAFFALLGGSIDGNTIPGKGEGKQINEPGLYGMVKKKHFKYVVKPFTGSHIRWGMKFKRFEEFLDGNFFNGRCLFPFFLRLFRFFLRRVDRVGKVVFIGQPESALEIIKSTNPRSISDIKTGKDGMEMVFLQVSSPFCIGSNLEFHGKQNGAEHVRRKSWCRAEIRIAVSHQNIHRGEVKAPEPFHDLPGGSREGRKGIWIVFTQLCQDTFLIGGVSAGIKRFQ